MAVEIRFAESAVADLEGLTSWYAEQGAGEVNVPLVAAILDRIERLAEHLDMGPMVPEFGQPALREIIHPPFRIVYRRDPNAVRVVRVWSAERWAGLRIKTAARAGVARPSSVTASASR